MFSLPNELVVKIISGEISYNSILANEKNEIGKGYLFETQARVNSELSRNHSPQCSVSEEDCKKEDCVLYTSEKIGKLDSGWVCREYKVDFPGANFDSRQLRWRVGITEIDFERSLKILKNLKELGGNYACFGCHRIYEKKPEQLYEDGYGGRFIEMCGCGSDLFDNIDSFISRVSEFV